MCDLVGDGLVVVVVVGRVVAGVQAYACGAGPLHVWTAALC